MGHPRNRRHVSPGTISGRTSWTVAMDHLSTGQSNRRPRRARRGPVELGRPRVRSCRCRFRPVLLSRLCSLTRLSRTQALASRSRILAWTRGVRGHQCVFPATTRALVSSELTLPPRSSVQTRSRLPSCPSFDPSTDSTPTTRPTTSRSCVLHASLDISAPSY